jgi:flagellar biosynthesis protein FlhG
MDQAEGLRTIVENASYHRRLEGPRVISITSGKGGVGKTNLTANLAFALARSGKKVLVLDGDLGLANIDVLLGLAPQYTIDHLFRREKGFSDLLIEGPGGMMILPAASGILDLVDMNEGQKIFLLGELDRMAEETDLLLIDTGAGISSNVLYFNMAARETIVVVTPEPTSITDAYALIKVLSNKFQKRRFMLLVNLASDDREGREVYRNITRVADRFLESLSIDYLGFIPMDPKLPQAIRQQRAVLDLYPEAPSSGSIAALAERLSETVPHGEAGGQVQFFWKQLIERDHYFSQQRGEVD